jgi:hypothetical protein
MLRPESLLVACLLAAGAYCCYGQDKQAGDVPDRITCTLELTGGAFLVGERISTKVVLENDSDTPTRVYRPQIKGAEVLKLVIEGPDGKLVPFIGGQPQYFPGPWVPATLGGGNKMSSAEFNLGAFYSITKPGKYTAYALCKMPDKRDDVRSDKVRFEVKAPNGRFSGRIDSGDAFMYTRGALHVKWEVFTHTRDDVLRVYARQLLNEATGQTSCIAVGTLARETGLGFLVDEQGTLHLLYLTIVHDREYYAHDTVARSLKVARVALYRADKDTIPSFALQTNVEGAEKVPEEAVPEKADEGEEEKKE